MHDRSPDLTNRISTLESHVANLALENANLTSLLQRLIRHQKLNGPLPNGVAEPIKPDEKLDEIWEAVIEVAEKIANAS